MLKDELCYNTNNSGICFIHKKDRTADYSEDFLSTKVAGREYYKRPVAYVNYAMWSWATVFFYQLWLEIGIIP